MRSKFMDSIVIKTIEHVEGDYGLYTWPCAPLLAYLVHARKEFVRDKYVLELGAGTAVPGIMAVKVGARLTTLTDKASNARLMETLRRTCRLNHIPDTSVQILPLSWGIFPPPLLTLPPQDLILASDCFYDSTDFEDVIATVSYFMEKNNSCKFWTSYQERSSNRSLWPLLQRWRLKCESIPVKSVEDSSSRVRLQGPSPSKLCSNHTLHLWEITRNR